MGILFLLLFFLPYWGHTAFFQLSFPSLLKNNLFFHFLFNDVNQVVQFCSLALIIHPAAGIPEVPEPHWQLPVVMFDLFQVDWKLIYNKKKKNSKRHLEWKLIHSELFETILQWVWIVWKQKNLRHPKLFSISCEPQDRIILESPFCSGTNSGARCPQLLHCCRAGKAPPPHSSLAPPNSQWFLLPQGWNSDPKNQCWKDWKQKAHIVFRNCRKVWLGKEHKMHLFPTPLPWTIPILPDCSDFHPSWTWRDRLSLDIEKFCSLILKKKI